MDSLELMKERHAVRSYLEKPIEEEKRHAIEALVKEANAQSGLHMQVCFDEPKAFSTFLAHYGKFANVDNYLALVGQKSDEEKAGYFGESIVLKLQEMGLNSCWVALTYGKSKTAIVKAPGEKVLCVIAFGYGASAGVPHKSKPIQEVSSVSGTAPDYWNRGVEAALLAPTAVNQQKFLLTYKDGKASIAIKGSGFYTAIDLGIVKYHFELATGTKLNG